MCEAEGTAVEGGSPRHSAHVSVTPQHLPCLDQWKETHAARPLLSTAGCSLVDRPSSGGCTHPPTGGRREQRCCQLAQLRWHAGRLQYVLVILLLCGQPWCVAAIGGNRLPLACIGHVQCVRCQGVQLFCHLLQPAPSLAHTHTQPKASASL